MIELIIWQIALMVTPVIVAFLAGWYIGYSQADQAITQLQEQIALLKLERRTG